MRRTAPSPGHSRPYAGAPAAAASPGGRSESPDQASPGGRSESPDQASPGGRSESPDHASPDPRSEARASPEAWSPPIVGVVSPDSARVRSADARLATGPILARHPAKVPRTLAHSS